MKKTAFFCAVAAIAATPALADQKTYSVDGFTRVSVSAGIEATIAVGGDYSVKAEGDARGLERLAVTVEGGELRLTRRHKGVNWGRSGHVKVTVSTPSLQGLDVSSGASADAVGVDAGAFALEASSGAEADVAGRCDALTLEVSSGGDIDARDLKCRSANADASSGGSADLFASERVDGDASSGGSLDVYGSPKQVSKDTSSGGSVSIK